MDILLGIIIGMALTAGLVYLYIRGLVREVIADVSKAVEHVKEQFVPITVERVGDNIFCYNQDNNEFICQGATVAEIREAFGKRFPDKTAYLAGGDDDLVEELKAALLANPEKTQ